MQRPNRQQAGTSQVASFTIREGVHFDNELEQATLGGILNLSAYSKSANFSDGMEQVGAILQPEHFYAPRHRDIYAAILRLWMESKPGDERLDVFQVKRVLLDMARWDGIGMAYLAELGEHALVAPNLKPYVKVLLECYQRRELQASLSGSATDTGIKSLEEIMHAVRSSLDDLERVKIDPTGESVLSVVENAAHWLAEEEPKSSTMCQFGIPDLDAITGYLPTDRPIIVGARPGNGKTIFGFQTGVRNAKAHRHATLFNLEMSKRKVGLRMLSTQGKIDGSILTGRIKERMDEYVWDRLATAHHELSALPLVVYTPDEPMTVDALAASFRHHVKQVGTKLVVIDQLSQVVADGRTDFERMTAAIKGIKRMMVGMDTPVIVLCQINRAGADAPSMGNLKQTGAIEEESGLILLLEPLTDPSGHQGHMKITVAKNDSGQTGYVEVDYAAWKYTIG